MLAASQPHPG